MAILLPPKTSDPRAGAELAPLTETRGTRHDIGWGVRGRKLYHEFGGAGSSAHRRIAWGTPYGSSPLAQNSTSWTRRLHIAFLHHTEEARIRVVVVYSRPSMVIFVRIGIVGLGWGAWIAPYGAEALQGEFACAVQGASALFCCGWLHCQSRTEEKPMVFNGFQDISRKGAQSSLRSSSFSCSVFFSFLFCGGGVQLPVFLACSSDSNFRTPVLVRSSSGLVVPSSSPSSYVCRLLAVLQLPVVAWVIASFGGFAVASSLSTCSAEGSPLASCW